MNDLLLLIPAIASFIAAIVTSMKARLASRASTESAEKSELALVKEIEQEIVQLEKQQETTDLATILATINTVAGSPNQDAKDAADKAAKATKLNTLSIVFSTIFGILIFVATPVINILSHDPIPCVDSMRNVIGIARNAPTAWIPLADDDHYNQACHLNMVFEKAVVRN